MAIADLDRFGATRRSVLGAVAAMAALVVALSACSSDEASSTAVGAQDRGGAEVYAQACASCHGAQLQGSDKGPSMLSIVYEPNHHSDESFRRAIAVGSPQHHWNFGDMKPVAGLSGAEVDRVIEFVRSEQQRLGFDE